jgi:hypothetical protein
MAIPLPAARALAFRSPSSSSPPLPSPPSRARFLTAGEYRLRATRVGEVDMALSHLNEDDFSKQGTFMEQP